ncbi:MAG: hypothetical protein AAFN50_10990, partial [Pseudomonadota bacterium]
MKFVRFLASTVLLVFALPATADDLRPLYVEITELGGYDYRVQIKTPPTVIPENGPELVYPVACRAVQALPRGNRVECESSLQNRELAIRYPLREVPNSTIVRIDFVDG